MELDLTAEQRKFRDELRGYFEAMMTDALVHRGPYAGRHRGLVIVTSAMSQVSSAS